MHAVVLQGSFRQFSVGLGLNVLSPLQWVLVWAKIQLRKVLSSAVDGRWRSESLGLFSGNILI